MAGERVVIALYADERHAQRAVELYAERDFPLDMISVLGRAHASGDDPLGIYYHMAGERMRGWGKMGAFWGGVWGLLAGAAGLFVVPGIGAIAAAGPIVEALAGAAVGGGVMAGAGVVSHLAVGLRAQGIPEEKLAELHRAIEQGRYVVMIRCRGDECDRYRAILGHVGVEELMDFPFHPLHPD